MVQLLLNVLLILRELSGVIAHPAHFLSELGRIHPAHVILQLLQLLLCARARTECLVGIILPQLVRCVLDIVARLVQLLTLLCQLLLPAVLLIALLISLLLAPQLLGILLAVLWLPRLLILLLTLLLVALLLVVRLLLIVGLVHPLA